MSEFFTLSPEQKAAFHKELKDSLANRRDARAAPAVDATDGNVEKWSITRPAMAVCRRRFMAETDGVGRPYWLPIYNWIKPPDDFGVKGHPAGCAGPLLRTKSGARRSRFPCDKYHFCTYCWERRRRMGGLRAALYHTGQDQIVKFSISLPGVRANPEKVVEARRQVVKVLRRAGFDRQTVWVHTFGENPAQGPKGHLDGIASGPADADPGVFDVDAHDALQRVLRPFHERPDAGFWQPHVHHRSAKQPTVRKDVKELVKAGMYAGRPTFHTKRIWAGLYGPMHDLRVRMTYTAPKRKGHVTAPLEINGSAVKDWAFEDLYRATKEAEEWREIAGRTVMPRGAKIRAFVLDAVLDDTRWRRRYRLPKSNDLRERFL